MSRRSDGSTRSRGPAFFGTPDDPSRARVASYRRVVHARKVNPSSLSESAGCVSSGYDEAALFRAQAKQVTRVLGSDLAIVMEVNGIGVG